MSNGEHSLRALIGEQIAAACRARGFEVDTCQVDEVDSTIALWSIKIRSATQAYGPTKVGETEYLPGTGKGPKQSE
jgi:hypothetical protein